MTSLEQALGNREMICPRCKGRKWVTKLHDRTTTGVNIWNTTCIKCEERVQLRTHPHSPGKLVICDHKRVLCRRGNRVYYEPCDEPIAFDLPEADLQET
jgi:hypothetical protein